MTTTTWPGTVDATQTRTDGVDTVAADDFNYRDGQVRAIELWLGDGVEDLIGDDGSSSHGPGGLASPVASGGTAIKLAAKADYQTGKLLSVGDNLDAAYSEKAAIDANGKVTAAGVQLGATVAVTSILDEDDLASDSPTALATQQSIKAYVDAVPKTPGFYNKKQIVTSTANAVAVDCDDGFTVRHELTENTTIGAPAHPADGLVLQFLIEQTASHAYTVAWNGVFKFAGALDAIWQGKVLAIAFMYDVETEVWIELRRSYTVVYPIDP